MRKIYSEDAIEKSKKKRTIITAIIIAILIPSTILIGFFASHRNYMIVSVLILLYVMLPFFLVYEKRKPRAREVIMIAVLSALTAFGSIISASILPVQIGTAMCIISGISFGPEAGFLVGALGRFVCNFFQGQGPWTPWQMFCWGILGFLAGLIFNKMDLENPQERTFKMVMGPLICVMASCVLAYVSFLIFPNGDESFFGWRLYIFGAVGFVVGLLLQRKRLPIDDITLTVYTFFSVFIFYGGIINICALVTGNMVPGGNELNWTAMKALYISGVPFDAIHAFKAAVFMLFFGEKMIRKFERIKIKYGFYR